MLHAPVLQLDVARMHEIDPRNVESLFGMWTVFSRCASTIPDGKRLENLSWRVWARETLCCPPQPEKTIVPAIDIPLSRAEDVPSLSNSLGSDGSDDGSLPSPSSSASLENSALSKSRGKELHLTPRTLEKIVTNIQGQKQLERLDPAIEAVVNAKISPVLKGKQQQQESPQSDRSDQPSINFTTESSCLSALASTNPTTECNSQYRNSDTSVSSDILIRSGSVVHGFSPVPSLRSRSSVAPNLPIFASNNAAAKCMTPKKKGGMFTLGGSSEDEDSSFEARMSYRRGLLEPRKSSLSQSLTKEQSQQPKKTATFKEIIEEHRKAAAESESAVATDDEDEEDTSAIGDSALDDESAIEEEDEDAEWEDTPEGEEEKPTSEPTFKRVDSTAHLPSRRSILTAGLTEGDRAKGLLSAASRSSPALQRLKRGSSHNGPSMPSSPENDNEEGGITMQKAQGSRPITINSSSHPTYALAHSPRTTRRNMLSTELTESLRKNLLWERQQKNTTVNAFLKREAKSMANLQKAGQMAGAQPQPHRSLLRDPSRYNHSHNDYFNVANDYNTQGW